MTVTKRLNYKDTKKKNISSLSLGRNDSRGQGECGRAIPYAIQY